jgi:hypothetical protein
MKYRIEVTVEAARLAAIVDVAYKPSLDYDPELKVLLIDAAPMSPRGASIADAARRIKVKRGKVKHAAAVGMLAYKHPDVSAALNAWRNKSGGLHGWDRFLKARYPDQAVLVWPHWDAS